ncbi:MAG: class I SAM-dependent methyltransferase family protein [Candidatus Dormibacteraeota bacterium]|nr:class I SAM-dependent methyltransferase family protein [Candidatus Dormibacteraeota bacterium]MBV9524421.1 class I SAM-dependent methyltransferase family protein [Candidatus Dormibacteraeota bacterium]
MPLPPPVTTTTRPASSIRLRIVATDWLAWHEQYASGSALNQRLELVRRFIRAALDAQPPGEIRVLSMCAGDGRDILGVLDGHPRATDVRARLVEMEPVLAGRAREAVSRLGLSAIDVVTGDAGSTDAYAGIAPVNIALVCGVFGNITDDDIRATIEHLPELCAAGAHAVWTRGTFEPDLTPQIRRWFEESSFRNLAFEGVPGTTMAAGHVVLDGLPRPYRSGVRLFEFLPDEERPSQRAIRGPA